MALISSSFIFSSLKFGYMIWISSIFTAMSVYFREFDCTIVVCCLVRHCQLHETTSRPQLEATSRSCCHSHQGKLHWHHQQWISYAGWVLCSLVWKSKLLPLFNKMEPHLNWPYYCMQLVTNTLVFKFLFWITWLLCYLRQDTACTVPMSTRVYIIAVGSVLRQRV